MHQTQYSFRNGDPVEDNKSLVTVRNHYGLDRLQTIRLVNIAESLGMYPDPETPEEWEALYFKNFDFIYYKAKG